MDFRVLGPFEVLDGERAVPVGAFRQRAVLALLTIHAGQALSTDRIIEELWAGSPPPSALKTLRAYVSRLRAALYRPDATAGSAEILLSRDPGYVLAIDGSQIDAVRFEGMVDDAATSLRLGRAESAAGTIRDAMGLWRGTAFADFAYEPFAANESQRLMERRIEAVELRVDADLALARHASLVAELEGLVKEHPMRERLWVQLMTALYRCGRQAEALATYARVRRLLVEELGIEPGPDLRQAERQVLEQSDELDWKPAGLPWTDRVIISGRSGSGPAEPGGMVGRAGEQLLPHVGREVHLDRLAELIRTAAPEGTPRLAFVMGEAGCGKSRLLAEFRARATSEGVLMGVGSAERQASLPFEPFVEMIRAIIDITGPSALDRLGHLRPDLAWLLPELGPQPTVIDGDLGLARTRLFEAMLQFLAKAGAGEPLVLFVDDAHRLGDAAISFVHALLDRSWPRPVLVGLAVRTKPGGRPATMDDPTFELLRREGTTTLDVGRLSVPDLESLVIRLGMGSPGLDVKQFAGALGEQTAGIPLLVREVLARGPQAEPVAWAPSHSVSPLIEGVIGRRLNEVSKDAQRLLAVAAVLGLRFEGHVLAAVADVAPAEVAELLEEALQAGILVETGELDSFAFDHGLVRDVARGRLSASRQMRLHGRAAEVLAGRGAAVDAARNALLARSALAPEAVTDLVLAGADSALQALNFDEARGLCEDTLAGPAAELGPGVRADLLLRVGRAYSLMGRSVEAEDAWLAAADLARGSGDYDRLAQIALSTGSLGRVHMDSSEFRWDLLTEALERTGPGWGKPRLLVASEWLLEAVMPHRRAASPEFVLEVVDAAIGLGDPNALAAAYHARHVLARSRQLPQRRQWSDELVDLAEEIGASEWLFEGYLARLIDTAAEGDGPGMDEALAKLGHVCASYPAPRAHWLFELAAGSCARLRGEFDPADEHTAAAAALGERHGFRDSLAAVGAAAFVNAYHRGGLHRLRSAVTQFADSAPEVAAWTFACGLAAADEDDLGGARSALDRGMEVLPDEPEEIWLAGLCLATEIVGLAGADDATVERLSRLLESRAGRFAIIGTLSSEFGPTDRCLGILSAASGRFDRADEYFASAIVLCTQLGSRPWELRTRTDWLVADRWKGRPPRRWWPSLEPELRALGLDGAAARLDRGFLGA